MINKNTISSIIITEEVEVVNRIKETNKVQHHNNLIATYSKLNSKAMRMLEIIISCIDYENPPKDNIIYLDKIELFDMLNIKNTSKYTEFEEYLDEFQSLFLKVNNGEERKRINITSETIWSVNKKDTKVKIELGNKIMPYLLEHQEHFTQYQLRETIRLKSKHSIVLYKWLIMNYNKGNRYNNKGLKKPEIHMNELRILTNTEDVYKKHFPSFEKRILKDTIKEINDKTSLNVKYEKIKKGRSIDKIQFFIEEKPKDTGYLKLDDVIDEVTFIEYEKQQEEYEEKRRTEIINSEDNQKIYFEAMQNFYVLELIKSGYVEIGSIEEAVLAYKYLVPIYEEIDRKYNVRRESWITYHTEYDKEKFDKNMSAKEKNNYLKEKAKSYLYIVESGRAYQK